MSVILITGGTGFVGRFVTQALVARGDHVVSFDRDFHASTDDRVVTVQGELFELPRLMDVLRRYDVERIVHTAAQSHPEVSIDLPLTTFSSNVDGTLMVFEAARLASVSRVVSFSSECAYGNQDGPVDEDRLLAPTTPYGVTKATTEMLGQVYSDLYGLDVLSLRVSEVYGPGNRMPEILKEMIQAGLGGPPVVLEHGSEQTFQFVHVDDVVRAAVLALDLPDRPVHRVFNVTGGSQLRLDEAAQLVRDLLPDARITVGPGHIPHWDRQGPFDLSRARAVLGYEPKIPLEEGLRTYSSWLGRHPY